jgi:hypothetical protein
MTPRVSRLLGTLAAIAAFCCAPALGRATVLFHNTGTLSGWDGSNLDANCSLTESTSQVYKGTTSIKSQVNYNSGYTGRYHAMKYKNGVYHPGDTGFYGFAFFLQSAWDFQNQQYQLFQFIADFSNTGCDDFMPSTMVWIYGNQLNTRRKYGSICDQHIQTYSNLATVSAGVWHRVVIQALWKTDSTGYLKLWFDGTKVLENFNIATTISDPSNRYYRMDVGIYANSWHDEGRCLGSTTRYAYFDQIGWGTTFADADPAQW